MNQAEFIKECSQRGYCAKELLIKYVKLHPKEEYTEEDMEETFRYSERVIAQRQSEAGMHIRHAQNGTEYKSTKEYYSRG